MICSWMQRRLARYSAGELNWHERLAARAHLRLCDRCFEEYERREAAEGWAARLAPARVPAKLEISIRLALSRELAGPRNLAEHVLRFRQQMREWVGPIAVRSAGLLTASLLLFGILMPDIWRVPASFPNDVPLTYMAGALFTPPSIEEMGPYVVHQDATVLVFVDMRGALYDIQLPDDLEGDTKLRAELTNALLFTAFQPATRFGKPVAGQVLIHFTATTVHG
jgi:hypothetical protein